MSRIGSQTRALACLLGGCGLAAIPAQATQPVPKIDSTAYCDEAAKNPDEGALKKECLDGEAKAERHIWTLWSGTPEPVREECVKNLEPTAPSYQSLSTCITGMMNLMRQGGIVAPR